MPELHSDGVDPSRQAKEVYFVEQHRQAKGGKRREIPVRLELQRDILAYLEAAGIGADVKTGQESWVA
ncbi:MAG: hypothetical protein ACLQIB_45330 [Isosphaeraceae bacterium]